MKNIYKFLFIVAFSFRFLTPVLSQAQSEGDGGNGPRLVNPLYDLRASNFQLPTSPGSSSNVMYFDIFIYHTNQFESGPFEYSAGQFYFNFNTEISNGGILTYSIVPNSSEFTNPDAVPINPAVVGDQLRLERNPDLGAGNGPIVSAIYPGTRVVRMKLETTAESFNLRNINLRWRDSTYGTPYTKTFAYIDSMSTDITDDGTMMIDPIGVLPVELSSFSANVLRNDVTLNWATVTESNNSGFDIERSRDNSQWTKIGFERGNGTSSSLNNYSFEDKNLNSGRYNYRLKQIDFNGNFEYHNLQNEVLVGIPGEFNLKQNYPNPFNPTTKIDFDIPKDGFVSLKVFDINGRELKTIVNEFKNSGYYTVDFNASSIPSGAYFYRLESGNFTATKTLVILK
jgi:Secretion system C-terminal sorting domain